MAKRHHGVLESILTALALAVMVAVNLTAEGSIRELSPRLIGLIAVPLGYMLLARLLAGMSAARSSQRAYMLGFVTGLMGMFLAASELLLIMSEAVGMEAETSLILLQGAMVSLPNVLVEFLVPFLYGVSLYLVFSCQEEEGGTGSAHTSPDLTPWFQRWESWLQTSDAPEVIRRSLSELGQQLAELSQSYHHLQQHASATSDVLNRVHDEAAAAGERIDSLHASAKNLGKESEDLRREFDQLTADSRAVRSEVRSQLNDARSSLEESREVMDQFADLVSHRILEESRPAGHQRTA